MFTDACLNTFFFFYVLVQRKPFDAVQNVFPHTQMRSNMGFTSYRVKQNTWKNTATRIGQEKTSSTGSQAKWTETCNTCNIGCDSSFNHVPAWYTIFLLSILASIQEPTSPRTVYDFGRNHLVNNFMQHQHTFKPIYRYTNTSIHQCK